MDDDQSTTFILSTLIHEDFLELITQFLTLVKEIRPKIDIEEWKQYLIRQLFADCCRTGFYIAPTNY